MQITTDTTTRSVTSPQLYITSAPQHASVTMNNKELGRTPLITTPEKGTCRIGLSLPGYQPFATDIMVTSQLYDTLMVVMIPESKAMHPTTGKFSHHRKILRFSLGGGSVISAITGIVGIVKMNNVYNTWQSKKDDPIQYDKKEKEFRKYFNMSAASVGITLLCATGIVFTYVF